MSDTTPSTKKNEYFPGEYFEEALNAEFGYSRGDFCVPECSSSAGRLIIMCGYAGFSGAYVLCKEKKAELLSRFSESYLKNREIQKLFPLITEAENFFRNKGYGYIPALEGGVFGALFTLSKENRLGFTVDMKKIPILQQTVEICNFLGGNPYKLYSAGAFIGCIRPEDEPEFTAFFKEHQIPSAVIGVTQKGVKKILLRGDEIRYLERTSKTFVLNKESAL